MLKKLINSVRRNHALEHATISVLLRKYGQIRVVGRAAPDGFYIYGDVPTDRLEEFADEALARLQRGEAHLAVSPHCGTNIAVAGLLAGIGSYVAMGARSDRLGGLPGAIVASVAAVIASQPVGRWVQRNYTTSPEVAGMRVVSVKRASGLLSNIHKVRTAVA